MVTVEEETPLQRDAFQPEDARKQEPGGGSMFTESRPANHTVLFFLTHKHTHTLGAYDLISRSVPILEQQ